VVLHGRDDDLVVRLQSCPGEAVGDQVDRLRRATDEDNLAGCAGVHKPLHGGARRVVRLGGTLAQRMHAAVNVGALVGVEARNGVDHRPGFLTGGGVVQVHEWPGVHGLLQDGEVGASALHGQASLPSCRAPALARSRSTNFVTLPEAFMGSDSTSST
jgi:hypothetical protein